MTIATKVLSEKKKKILLFANRFFLDLGSQGGWPKKKTMIKNQLRIFASEEIESTYCTQEVDSMYTYSSKQFFYINLSFKYFFKLYRTLFLSDFLSNTFLQKYFTFIKKEEDPRTRKAIWQFYNQKRSKLDTTASFWS